MEERITLTELMDVSILQKMQDTFAKMARMAALTTDEVGEALTTPTNFTEICSGYCRCTEKGEAHCKACSVQGTRLSREQGRAISYKCHTGLIELAAPIRLEDKVIGSLIGGQVLVEEPDLENISQIADELGADKDAFILAIKKVQVIPQAAIDRSSEFLYEFAQIISDMAYNAYVSKQLREEAMQAAIQKSDFLANMSHEIRTPMNAVLGMAEMALRSDMPQEAREYVQQIQSSGKHLLVIINDILDFSKIDSGKMEIVEVVYETEAMLHDISNLINSRIGEKNIDFLIDVPQDMPIELYGDNIRIQQILINLLNNAVKFTTRGKITLRMRFEELDSDTVMVTADVSDTGNGIKEENLEKIFQSFQQVDSKRNRNIEGTGLGLAISRQLIENMGGSISVTSKYGNGSTFTIRYPQKVQTRRCLDFSNKYKIYTLIGNENIKSQIDEWCSLLDAQVIDLSNIGEMSLEAGSYVVLERALMGRETEIFIKKYPNVRFILIDAYNAVNSIKDENVVVLHKPVYSLEFFAALGIGERFVMESLAEEDIFSFIAPDANILVVDDNPINRSVAKGLLQPLQMQVDVAESAADCIAQVSKKSYDIVFMDYMMPDVDGVEATNIIRQMIEGYDKVPIIALSANAVGGAREMFLNAGMNDFVAKPIETAKIVAMIKKWLPAEKIVPSVYKKTDTEAQAENSAMNLVVEGVDVKAGIALLGTEALYMKILEEYYFAIDKRAEIIKNAFDSKDYEKYTIEVHSLKSTSKQIGAMGLSAFAAQLEKAGHEKDYSFIDDNTESLLMDYMKLKLKLKPVFAGKEEEQNVAEKEVLLSLLQQMKSYIPTEDYEEIQAVLATISSYHYQDPIESEFLDEIKESFSALDLDMCDILIEQWVDYLG